MSQVVYGINPVLEVLKSHPELIEEIWIEKKTLSGKKYQILEKAQKLGIPLKMISKTNFNPPKVGSHVNTQGVVAYLSRFKYADLEEIVENWERKGEVPLVLILDEVEDPQNVGAIVRSADAVNVGKVYYRHQKNIKINNLNNVKIEKKALGDKEGKISFSRMDTLGASSGYIDNNGEKEIDRSRY